MKSFIPLLAAASLVAAQDYSGQPKCAIPCLNKAIPQVGCSLQDTDCQCNKEKQSQLAGIVAPCLLQSCGASDLMKAQAAASAACAAFASTAGNGFMSTASDNSASGSSASIPTNHLLPPVPSTQTQTGSHATPSAATMSVPSTPTTTGASTPTEAPTTTAASSAAGSSTTTASSSSAGAADLAAGGALLMFAAALAV